MEIKNNCQELYDEYLALKESCKMPMSVINGQALEISGPKDFEKRKELAHKLYNECKDFFKDKPNELFDLEQDVSF